MVHLRIYTGKPSRNGTSDGRRSARWAQKLTQISESVSQLFHGPAPRSPLYRLAIRLRHSRSNTSTEYSLPGATQLSQVRSISPSGQGVPCRFLPCAATVGRDCVRHQVGCWGWGGGGGSILLSNIKRLLSLACRRLHGLTRPTIHYPIPMPLPPKRNYFGLRDDLMIISSESKSILYTVPRPA